MDKDFASPIEVTLREEKTNKSGLVNQRETISLIRKYFDKEKSGVLDIGERNYLTVLIESEFDISVDNTSGDLDEELDCPKMIYDIVHYNNVIEHQFNPLFTLLEIKKVLSKDGILILGCPVKPHWITWCPCHYHEFDLYRIHKLIERAGYRIVEEKRFYRSVNLFGIRPLLGSFFKRQYLAVLKKL